MGGVIFTQNTEGGYRRFAEIGIDTDKYMGAYGQKDFFFDVETGAITEEQFCQKLSETVGREVSWQEAQYCWLGFVDGVEDKRLRNLETLRLQGYHLCLLSNTNPFIMAHMKSTDFSSLGKPITDYFDTLFCSYEMQVYKPAPEIFHKALAMDNMKAEECLFVDDSEKNTKAAEALGFNVIHTATNEDWMEKVKASICKSAQE